MYLDAHLIAGVLVNVVNTISSIMQVMTNLAIKQAQAILARIMDQVKEVQEHQVQDLVQVKAVELLLEVAMQVQVAVAKVKDQPLLLEMDQLLVQGKVKAQAKHQQELVEMLQQADLDKAQGRLQVVEMDQLVDKVVDLALARLLQVQEVQQPQALVQVAAQHNPQVMDKQVGLVPAAVPALQIPAVQPLLVEAAVVPQEVEILTLNSLTALLAI